MSHGSASLGRRVIRSHGRLVLLLVLLAACAGPMTAPATPTATPVPPTDVPTSTVPAAGPDYWPTDGWRVSTPEEQGIDSVLLAVLMDFIRAQISFDIHSLLIIRHGYVVTDAAFYPFPQGSLHDLASATKSFLSTLIGIAMDQGHIESVDQLVLDLLPEHSVANLDAGKAAMTLEDLLTMRSGLECDVDEAVALQVLMSDEWVQFVLDLPMASQPGTVFSYCNYNSHILSAILTEATGMSALAFAQEHLFGSLGISDSVWFSDPEGYNFGHSELHLAPHDMAKLGYLFLHGGRWGDRQVVSAEWVKTATRAVTEYGAAGRGYGYQWWVDLSGYYEAAGMGGQQIYVLPALDMVVVMTGTGTGGGPATWTERLLKSYIIPAAESTVPLPANPEAVAVLEARIREAAAPVRASPEPVPPMPEIAGRVDGITYQIDENWMGIRSIALSFPVPDEAQLEVTTLGSRPGTEDPHIQWRIGLDGVERIAPGSYDMPASARGSWESDSVFVAEIDEFADCNRMRIRFTFAGDEVAIEMWNSGALVAALTGRATG